LQPRINKNGKSVFIFYFFLLYHGYSELKTDFPFLILKFMQISLLFPEYPQETRFYL